MAREKSPFESAATLVFVSMALMTAGGGGHPDYHDSGDDTSKVDPEILRKTAQFVLQGTMNLANETDVQLLVPDRLYLYNSLMMRITAAKRALYFGLIKLGWKPEDIAAFAGNSLRSLSPGAAMARPGMMP